VFSVLQGLSFSLLFYQLPLHHRLTFQDQVALMVVLLVFVVVVGPFVVVVMAPSDQIILRCTLDFFLHNSVNIFYYAGLPSAIHN
jgi:hypothetical protein